MDKETDVKRAKAVEGGEPGSRVSGVTSGYVAPSTLTPVATNTALLGLGEYSDSDSD